MSLTTDPAALDAVASPAKATAPKAQAKSAATKATPAADLRKIRDAAILLKQASDATRLQVLLLLLDGERNVGDLCSVLGQSQPAVSHHIALCRHGRLIEPRRAGKNNFYSLTDSGRKLATMAKAVIGD